MNASSPADSAGNSYEPGAMDALFVEVYERLKVIAHSQLSRDGASTIETTSLVHELYERMARQNRTVAERPIHFFAYAARAMRNIITDRARQRVSQKFGGDLVRVTLSKHGEEAATEELAMGVLVLDEALSRLAQQDERAAKVVELRYFAGLSVEQIAEAMDVNRRTITRDWDFARAFLRARLDPQEG